MDQLIREKERMRERVANMITREAKCKKEQAFSEVEKAKCGEEVVQLRSKFDCEEDKDKCLIEKHEARCQLDQSIFQQKVQVQAEIRIQEMGENQKHLLDLYREKEIKL